MARRTENGLEIGDAHAQRRNISITQSEWTDGSRDVLLGVSDIRPAERNRESVAGIDGRLMPCSQNAEAQPTRQGALSAESPGQTPAIHVVEARPRGGVL